MQLSETQPQPPCLAHHVRVHAQGLIRHFRPLMEQRIRSAQLEQIAAPTQAAATARIS